MSRQELRGSRRNINGGKGYGTHVALVGMFIFTIVAAAMLHLSSPAQGDTEAIVADAPGVEESTGAEGALVATGASGEEGALEEHPLAYTEVELAPASASDDLAPAAPADEPGDPQPLAAEAEGYRIVVDLGGLDPSGYALQARPIRPTAEQLSTAQECLSEEVGDGTTRQAHIRAENVRAFDLCVVDGEGDEVVLGEPASVTVLPTNAASVPAEGVVPEVVHLTSEGAERLLATAEGDGFVFETQGFSPYLFVYAADFTNEGQATDPPSPEAPTDPDPASTPEPGATPIAPASDPDPATDDHDLRNFLTQVEFWDGDVLVGDSMNPNPMMVRPGHEYTMKLSFAESETGTQFPDEGVMSFAIPPQVHLSDAAFDENHQVTFDIVLGRKYTLAGNTVTYVHASGSEPARLDIVWNTADVDNFRRLTDSPRTAFMLNIPHTVIDPDDVTQIPFSASISLNVNKDEDYGIDLQKTAVADAQDASIIHYTVVATADGEAQNATITDVMGAALTYRGDLQVTYLDRNETPDETYAPANATVTPTTDPQGFALNLATLKGGHKAVITYTAKVDFSKLGGKENIDTTSRNTVTARNGNGDPLDEDSQVLEDIVNYLQVGKARGTVTYLNEDGEPITDAGHEEEHYVADHWASMSVGWKVIYNPDCKIDVEGASLNDQIWKGAKEYTTYDLTRPFKVTAYAGGTYVKAENGGNDTFSPSGAGIPIVAGTDEDRGWGGVAVTSYDATQDQLSAWSWTIPDKTTSGLDANTHYTYVIEYYTTVVRSASMAGYVGNRVTESIASITRDKSVEFPGKEPGTPLTVEKEHLQDDYVPNSKGDTDVYTQWQITFKRRTSGMERALVEDTLPHTLIGDQMQTDSFVDASDANYAGHEMVVSGLQSGEHCEPSVAADKYDVVFEFFTHFVEKDSPQNVEGLRAGNGTDENDTITITYWTKNSGTWIRETAAGNPQAPTEHWNHVHLVLNGKEATSRAYAVPKPEPKIEKKPTLAGTWTNADGVTLPVYRYTLTLSGLSDDMFKTGLGGERYLEITDEYDETLDYLAASSLPEAEASATLTGSGALSGKTVNMTSRSATDECLVRTYPLDTTTTWTATVAPSTATEANKKALTITVPYSDAMKYAVKDENGDPMIGGDGQPIYNYSKTYEVSYYLALDHTQVKQRAQTMVDSDHTSTSVEFHNTATWNGDTETAGANTVSASVVSLDLKPVNKKLLSYDEKSELATYSIEVNPLKLTMNNGQRYSVQDSYTNLAVDFQTVRIACDPPEKEADIEWSYHGNKGTFWVPDETKVTITYEGWPVGRRTGADLQFSNTVTMGGYDSVATKTTKLTVDHEGYASTYRVRIFKFEDDNMAAPLPGAVFQLFRQGDDGEPEAMTYVKAHSGGRENHAWEAVNEGRTETGDPLANPAAKFPTPENHAVGDYIYFVTGDGGANSDQPGFAEVMLSQSRDGLSLHKYQQYYLKEVLEPTDHLKEDILWRFIISDNDDFDNYVYSDDSILQVSNASVDRVLTVRKTVVDRTAGTQVYNGYDEYQKDIAFSVVGTDATGKVIYNKTSTYDDFKAVSLPQPGGGTKREYLFIIHSLPAGTYTVSEVRGSAQTPTGSTLTTYVSGTASTVQVDDAGEPITSPAPLAVSTENDGLSAPDAADATLQFEVSGDAHTKTTAEVEFTNVYVDEPTSLSIQKTWDSAGKDGFTPKQAEFALLADGQKYDLTQAEGANERGNIVLAAGANSADGWTSTITIPNLPGTRSTTSGGTEPIVWTVQEVGAVYRMSSENKDTNVSDVYLNEHFKVVGNTVKDGDTFSATFTNTLNSLVAVEVRKAWADAPGVDHDGDVVYFDLYRTTSALGDNPDYHAIVEDQNLTPVVPNIELSEVNDWTYENKLLEKFDTANATYNYFVVERSVAGYEDSYTVTGSSNKHITITNTPLNTPDEQLGTLAVSKAVEGDVPNDLSKTYQFTLWNSGKYLHEDGSLTTEPYVFSVAAGATTTFTHVKYGTYVLTEVEDAAQIGGYEPPQTSIDTTVNEGAATTTTGATAEVTVTARADGNATAPASTASVTNTYTKKDPAPTTGFTFGKLWAMPAPNPDESATLVWPNDTSITMAVGRRVAGKADQPLYTYVISKDGSGSITAEGSLAPGSPATGSVPELSVHNPDAPDAQGAASYHHYTFSLNELPRYDDYGNELAYYAQETSVKETKDSTAVELLGATSGKRYDVTYGFVDGIGVRTVASWTDAASNRSSVVPYAINRLSVLPQITIPVQKYLNGWSDWNGDDQNTFPAFMFGLYDDEGHPITVGDGPQPAQVTATSDESGQASFDVTSLIRSRSEDLRWWGENDTLRGSFTFYLKELANSANPNGADVLSEDVQPYDYRGIQNFAGSAKVTLSFTYAWATGELSVTKQVSNAGLQPEGTQGTVVINNTYDPQTTSLTVHKEWDDANNQDGYRRTAKFKVTAKYRVETGDTSGAFQSIGKVWFVKSGSGGQVRDVIDLSTYRIEVGPTQASTTVTLPKYFEGHLVTYSVEEMPGESTVAAATGQTAAVTLADKYGVSALSDTTKLGSKNTHVPETIGVSVRKAWDHTGNGNATQPDTVQVYLKATYASGSTTKTITHENVGSTTAWADLSEKFAVVTLTGDTPHTWSGLPRFAPGEQGKLVSYSIEEVPESIPVGYRRMAAGEEGVVVATTAEPNDTAENVVKNKYENTTIPLTKTWADDSDRDGLRPTGSTTLTFTLGAKVGTADITNELVAAADCNLTSDTVAKTLTAADVDGTDANTWTGAGWVDLPQYYHGQQISYTVTETLPTELESAVMYRKSGPSASGTFTNTHDILTTSIVLTKTWDDDTNRDNVRPSPEQFVSNVAQLTAQLANGGEPTVLTLGAKKQGSGLVYPLLADGQPFKSAEVEIVGSNGQDTSAAGYNTYTVTYRNLPRRRDGGTTIHYALRENAVEGYARVDDNGETIAPASGQSFTNIDLAGADDDTTYANRNIARTAVATNKHVPKLVRITLEKEWDHGTGNPLTNLPTHSKFELTATPAGGTAYTAAQLRAWEYGGTSYGIEPEQVLENDHQSYTWEQLPAYAPGSVGKALTYGMRELAVHEGYVATKEPEQILATSLASDPGTIVVTNRYESVDITATKAWDDANNQDGLRQAVTFKLQESRDNVTFTDLDAVASKEVGTANGTSVVWEGMPAWRDNQRVYYRAVEVGDPTSYTSDSGSATFTETHLPGEEAGTYRNYELVGTITNSHTPATKTATFTKQWDHQGASDYPSTSEYLGKLHLWARVQGATTDPVEVSGTNWAPALVANNDWKAHATVSVGAGGSYTIAVADLPVNKPQGAEVSSAQPLEYFITEDAVENYAVAYPPTTLQASHPNDMAAEGEAIANTRQTGSLAISKTVTSDPITDKHIDFGFSITSSPKVTGTYNVTYTGRTSEEGTIAQLTFDASGKAEGQILLKDSQSIAIAGLPVGVDYAVEEVSHASFDVTSVPANGVAQTHANQASPDVVAFTNERQKGDLVVRKNVVSSVQEDKQKTYRFRVTLGILHTADALNATYGTVTFTNGVAEFDLANGEEKRIEHVPVGASYKVEEIGPTEADLAHLEKFDTTWTKTLDEAVVAGSGRVCPEAESADLLVAQHPSTVDVRNTRKTSQLTLVKTLRNPIPDDDGNTFYYDITLTGSDAQLLAWDAAAPLMVNGVEVPLVPGAGERPLYYDAVHGMLRNVPVVWHGKSADAPAGGSTTIGGLPQGTTFEVLQTGYTTETGGVVTNLKDVTAEPQPRGLIGATGGEASFQSERTTGGLSVTKTVESPIAAERSADAEYRVRVALVTTSTAAADSPMPVADISATLARTPAAGEGTTGEALSFADGTEEIAIHPGETITIAGIPADVSYEVQELGADLFDIAYTGEKGPILAGETAEAFVANTRKLGSLAVEKSVVSAVASDHEHAFSFVVELEVAGPEGEPARIDDGRYGGEGDEPVEPGEPGEPGEGDESAGQGGMVFANNRATFTLVDGESCVATGLPVGVAYTVREVADTDEEQGCLDKLATTWTQVVGEGEPADGAGTVCPAPADGDATDGGDVPRIAEDASVVAFTNTRKTGELELSKVVKSPFESEQTAAYTLRVVLRMPEDGETLDATGVTGGTVAAQEDGSLVVEADVREGEPVVLAGLPTDALYQVSEAAATDASLFTQTVSYPVSTEDDAPQITAGQTQPVQVTNTRRELPISLVKVSAADGTTALAGAEFTLEPVVAQGEESPVAWTSKELMSVADTGWLVEKGAPSAADAHVFLLAPGTYRLEETRTPNGYQRLEEPVTFTIAPTGVMYKDAILASDKSSEVRDGASADERVVELRISNTLGVELPATGGAGTAAYYVAGGTLLAVAVAVAVAARARRRLQG